jgi:hypothetical protein
MCRLSSSQYDHYRGTDSERGRSLLAWLRELWARGRPKPAPAEVLVFPSEAVKRAAPRAEGGGSKAA